jgi:hypothetical protein
MSINPTALVFVALAAVIGALLGSVLIGLAVGLGIVLAAQFVR